MADQPDYQYEVFLSFADADRAWVKDYPTRLSCYGALPTADETEDPEIAMPARISAAGNAGGQPADAIATCRRDGILQACAIAQDGTIVLGDVLGCVEILKPERRTT